jgi:hypothetical protein
MDLYPDSPVRKAPDEKIPVAGMGGGYDDCLFCSFRDEVLDIPAKQPEQGSR